MPTAKQLLLLLQLLLQRYCWRTVVNTEHDSLDIKKLDQNIFRIWSKWVDISTEFLNAGTGTLSSVCCIGITIRLSNMRSTRTLNTEKNPNQKTLLWKFSSHGKPSNWPVIWPVDHSVATLKIPVLFQALKLPGFTTRNIAIAWNFWFQHLGGVLRSKVACIPSLSYNGLYDQFTGSTVI